MNQPKLARFRLENVMDELSHPYRGSCQVEVERITLNLELAKKSRECLEYILVHEMVHLLERHHNDQFRTYMDKFVPQWRWHRDVLNQSPLTHEDWRY